MLAFRVGDGENQQVWGDLFENLKEVDFWISDENQAMINAMTAEFGASQRQCCVIRKEEFGV